MSAKNLRNEPISVLSTPLRLGTAAVAACFLTLPVLANPTNGTVVSGSATFNQVGNVLTVTNSNGAIINWNTFSIGAGETTRFIQASASSSVLNRVLSNDPSRIYGTLTSNGRVWLVNPAGIMVGAGGVVDVAGFVASTLNISNENFLAGKKLFDATPGAGSVVNQGTITTPSGGSVYLIAPNVSNEGIIRSPNGEVILAAGQTVNLIDSATPGVKVEITGAEGNATNLGEIVAEAGRIGMAGVLVRNSGTLNASSVVNEGGRIFLRATKTAILETGSKLRADGGGQGTGGNVLVWSDENTYADGVISARGGAGGGAGGFVETSGRSHLSVAALRVDTGGGQWLLDPNDFVIGTDITGAVLSGNLASNDVTILSNDGSSGVDGDILVNDAVTWSSAHKLTLSAYRDVVVNMPISGGSGSTVVLHADNMGTGTGTVVKGASGMVNTAADRHLNIYYNPASYAAPTDYSAMTSSGPYTAWMLVNDVNDLQAIASNLAGTYALGKSVDATITASWNGGDGFVPLGTLGTPFTGQFDGMGKTISNLCINASGDQVGLFGYAAAAAIKNVSLMGSSISGQYDVGGLVGRLDGGAIDNVYAHSSTLTGLANVGGLVGQAVGNAQIANSSTAGNAEATESQSNVGGLVGLAACCGAAPLVQSSSSSADVTGVGNVGGLVGWLQSGVIDASSSSGNVVGTGGNVGGLAGKAGQGNAGSPASIQGSYFTGGVTGAHNVGGLVGLHTDFSTVTGSHVSGASVGGQESVGGLVGRLEGTVADSYVESTTVAGIRDVGGLAGFNERSDGLANSHYNVTDVTINGATRVTEGALYPGQYSDWYGNGLSLSFANYTATLPLNGGYYEISDAAGLMDLLGFANSPGAKFRLTGNINVSGISHGWYIPHFSALEFDGANHSISGLNLSVPNTHVALFGRFDGSDLKNISVSGSVTGDGRVAGLVGLNRGTITNASSSATVVGGNGYDIGGLVGFNYSGSIVNSTASGSVTGGASSTRVGGLVGANWGTITDSRADGAVGGWREVGGLVGGSSGNIDTSYATGTVSGTGDNVGGLVGRAYAGGINDSYATGNVNGGGQNTGGLVGYNQTTVTSSYASGTVTGGNWYAGGLIGKNEGAVTYSYATGDVLGTSGVGGLAGLNYYGSIGQSYASGSVTGMGGGSGYDIGGLVGENRGAIVNSYATGAVSGSSDRVGGLAGYNADTISSSYATGLVTSPGPNVGGLVGDDGGGTGTATSSFWDMDTTGQSASAGGGTGLNTAAMKTAATFLAAGWSATDWNLANGAYPTLKNMPSAGCVGFDNCWTGAIDNLWATAGNWTAGHAPTGSESVRIDVAGTPTIALAGVNPSFGSLWLAENLDVDAGVAFVLGNLFTLSSGTATFNGNATMHSYVQTGGVLSGSGNFTVTNSYLQSGGTINRTGSMMITQASGPLGFAASQIGSAVLNADAIVLGPVNAGNMSVTTDSLQVAAPVTVGLMALYPKTHAAIRLGSAAANTLSLLQSDLDNLGVGEAQFFAPTLTVNNGANTVTLANFDTVQLGSQVSIDSPLALTQPGSTLFLNAKRIDINETISAGAGGVFLGQNASNVAYLVGVGSKTYPANTVELSNAELNRIVTTGPVVIGDPYNAHNVNHGSMQIVGPIDLTGITTQLRLVGNGITQAAGATITVPQLAADGYGTIDLSEANVVGTFAAKSANGDVNFVSAGPLTIGRVATTASPANFITTGVVANNAGGATITAAGPLTLAAGAGEAVGVSAGVVWLNFSGDLSLNAGAGGQAYVAAAEPATIHLDFANSAGKVRFNGTIATEPTNGLAGPGTPNFIGFWDSGAAAIPGATLLLTNTTFSFGGASCIGFDNCWSGAVDSLWATAGNWTAGHAPTGGENVKIDVAGTPTISLVGVNPSFGSLWLAENLNVDAGVSFVLSNLFTLNSGTATFNGAANVHNYAQTGGTLSGSGAFAVSNSFAQTGGSINRSGNLGITHAGNLVLGDITTSGSFSALASGSIAGSHVVRAGSMSLTSLNGGASSGRAIDLDVETTTSLTATVVGGSYGGIRVSNSAVSTPATIALTDNAGSQRSVAYYQEGDLALGAGHTFAAGTGGIAVATGGSMSGIETARFSGTPAQLTLIADQDMNLSGALSLPTTHIGLGASSGILTFGYAVGGQHVTLAGGTLDVNAAVTASGDLAVGAGTLNVNAAMGAQDVVIGAGSLNVGPSGGVTATNQSASHLFAVVTGNALIDGGYLKTMGGDLQMIVGGNLTLGNGGHIWAGYTQMSPPWADASIAIGGNLVLSNGASINAANDIFLDMLGANSEIRLNGGGLGPSYILSDIGTGHMSTTHVTFAARTSPGIFIDGEETTETVAGGSGFYAVDLGMPALEGSGLVVNYANQANGSIAQQLAESINRAAQNASTTDNPTGGDTPGFDTAKGDTGDKGDGFGDEDERKKREEGKVDEGKKEQKPAAKRLAQCI